MKSCGSNRNFSVCTSRNCLSGWFWCGIVLYSVQVAKGSALFACKEALLWPKLLQLRMGRCPPKSSWMKSDQRQSGPYSLMKIVQNYRQRCIRHSSVLRPSATGEKRTHKAMKLRGKFSATQFFLWNHAASAKMLSNGMVVSLDTRIYLSLDYLLWQLNF